VEDPLDHDRERQRAGGHGARPAERIEQRDEEDTEGTVQAATNANMDKTQRNESVIFDLGAYGCHSSSPCDDAMTDIARAAWKVYFEAGDDLFKTSELRSPNETHAAGAVLLPRSAEQNIATSAMKPPTRKLKFIAWTNTAAFAGVGVAAGSPL